MRRTDFSQFHCSLGRALDIIGDLWTPLIIRDLALGLDQFDQFAQDLGISRNLLTIRLRALVKNGVLERIPYNERPLRWRYQLTSKGRALIPILTALTAWGDEWAGDGKGPPMKFRHCGCGEEMVPTVCCPKCKVQVEADSIEYLKGPGARAARGTMIIAQGVPKGQPD